METKTFAELGLSPKVLAAVESAGYSEATPIQSQAIPIALAGRDVLGIAQTGTGKTAAFTLPMITRLETGRARARMPRSLILAPTRELAAQVEIAFEKYGINNKLDIALLIGGTSMEDQIKKLDRGVDVLIATPGRLLDHFQRGRIMLMGVEILVIDEADRMLDMGFIPDIEKICRLLPPRRQTLFFSATMPQEITKLVQQFLKDPVRVEISKHSSTAKTITQQFIYCPDNQDWTKREILRNLLQSEKIKNAIIFCNRKRDVSILHKSLLKHGFNAGALHGDMDQKDRMDTLLKFRSGAFTYLAASDVAARGLDIPEVSHVFNFDLPWHPEDYVHRIGRTGRAGREGKALSIVTQEELKVLREIEKITGDKAQWMGEVPFAAKAKEKVGQRGRQARKDSNPQQRFPQNSKGSYLGDTKNRNKEESQIYAQKKNANAPPNSITKSSKEPSTSNLIYLDTKKSSYSPIISRNTKSQEAYRNNANLNKENQISSQHTAKHYPESDAKIREAYSSSKPKNGGIRTDPQKDLTSSFKDHIPAFLKKPTKRPQ